MYKIQNIMPGNLPIDLEQGSIMLTPGQTFDLDLYCSRKWIKTNKLLKQYFDAKAIRLIHDSDIAVPKPPIKKVKTRIQPETTDIAKKVPLPKTKPQIKKPKVIDLSTEQDPIEKVLDKVHKKSTKKSVKKEDKKEEKKEDADKVETSKAKDKKEKKTYKSFYTSRNYKKYSDEEKVEDKDDEL